MGDGNGRFGTYKRYGKANTEWDADAEWDAYVEGNEEALWLMSTSMDETREMRVGLPSRLVLRQWARALTDDDKETRDEILGGMDLAMLEHLTRHAVGGPWLVLEAERRALALIRRLEKSDEYSEAADLAKALLDDLKAAELARKRLDELGLVAEDHAIHSDMHFPHDPKGNKGVLHVVRVWPQEDPRTPELVVHVDIGNGGPPTVEFGLPDATWSPARRTAFVDKIASLVHRLRPFTTYDVPEAWTEEPKPETESEPCPCDAARKRKREFDPVDAEILEPDAQRRRIE